MLVLYPETSASEQRTNEKRPPVGSIREIRLRWWAMDVGRSQPTISLSI